MNAKETDKQNSSKALVKREDIENTPFTAIKDELGWFLVVGRYRVTEHSESKEELMSRVKGVDWELIGRVVGVIMETYKEVGDQ